MWSCLAVALFAVAAAAAEKTEPKMEVVAEWNSLPYLVKDAKIRERWESSAIYGKALLHGVKVDSQGNIYVSTARWDGKEIPATLSKLVRQGEGWALEAFPSEKFNAVDNPDGIKAVLGFEIDRNDVMWILDQGHIAGAQSGPKDEKLILWDIKANKEIKRYVFSDKDSDHKASFLNDVAVDNDTGFAYIADSGIFSYPLSGGLIIYDSNTNTARRILDKSPFTRNEPHFFFNIDGNPVTKGGPMLTGADGIALSGDKKTLYWTNLTGNTLYSLDAAPLRDFNTPEKDIEKAIRIVTSLPSNTDGITSDRDGNLYMTALTLNGLMRRDAKTGELTRFVYHKSMSWPDTVGWGPEKSLYVVSNHLNIHVQGDMDFVAPAYPNFRIWKIHGVGESYTAK
jgi:sugar lactone lactonase YvrE